MISYDMVLLCDTMISCDTWYDTVRYDTIRYHTRGEKTGEAQTVGYNKAVQARLARWDLSSGWSVSWLVSSTGDTCFSALSSTVFPLQKKRTPR